MTPTGRTVGLLAAVSVSVLWVPVPFGALVGATILVAAGIEAWSLRRPPLVTRAVPTAVVRGAAAQCQVEVVAPGRQVRVRQPQTADVRVEPSEGDGGLDASLRIGRRGRHLLPAVVTRSRGPLGLATWTHRHGGDAEITCHADLPGARRLAQAVQEGRFDQEVGRRGPLGLGTDFETIRDYTPDDDVRRINWLASERAGRPLVNQYREDTDRELWCLVDCGRLLGSPVGDRTRLDAALDAVAAVAAVADVVGDRIGAVVFDDHLRRVIRPRRANAQSLVRALDTVEPTVADSDYDAAFAQVGGAKRSLVVVFTDLLDVAAARPLTDAMATLTRHHAVVVASVTDPDLVAAVTGPQRVARDVHRAAVAQDLLDERRMVEANLRVVGARVVEAPVASFPSACVAAYLQLKASARL